MGPGKKCWKFEKWGRKSTIGRYSKIVEPELLEGMTTYDEATIAKEALLSSPIITGYNKSTRINPSPFIELFHSFTRDCADIPRVVIIGYSFGDPHVNYILRTIPSDSKITVVWKISDQDVINKTATYQEKIKILTHNFPVSFNHSVFRQDLATFYSDDGRISVFIDGVGESLYGNFSKI